MMHEIIKAHVRIPDILPDEKDLSAYKRLAASVILFAFNDAQKTSGDDYINARRFLCGDSWSLRLWCRWLNVHPDWIRAEAGNRGWCKAASPPTTPAPPGMITEEARRSSIVMPLFSARNECGDS
jgi:hypothetical protein